MCIRDSSTPAPRCTAGAPEAEICKTANALAGLFNLEATDAPDGLLTHGPAPKNVVARA